MVLWLIAWHHKFCTVTQRFYSQNFCLCHYVFLIIYYKYKTFYLPGFGYHFSCWLGVMTATLNLENASVINKTLSFPCLFGSSFMKFFHNRSMEALAIINLGLIWINIWMLSSLTLPTLFTQLVIFWSRVLQQNCSHTNSNIHSTAWWPCSCGAIPLLGT